MSDSTYLRARKDPDLRFEMDDKSRHGTYTNAAGKEVMGIEGYTGKNSWLAITPNNVKAWLDELFPVVGAEENDWADDYKELPPAAGSGDMKGQQEMSSASTRGDDDVHVHNDSQGYGDGSDDRGQNESKAAMSAGYQAFATHSTHNMTDHELKSLESSVSIPDSVIAERALIDAGNPVSPEAPNLSSFRKVPNVSSPPGSPQPRRASGPVSRGSTHSSSTAAVALGSKQTRSSTIKFEGVPGVGSGARRGPRGRQEARSRRRQYRASFYAATPIPAQNSNDVLTAAAAISAFNEAEIQRQNMNANTKNTESIEMKSNPMGNRISSSTEGV